MLRVALALALILATVAVPSASSEPGPGGAFTCDFGVSASVPIGELAPAIERDRMYMAERPGMLFKHIPMVPDPTTGNILGGGRYLFDTEANAREYIRWVRDDFELGGVPFLERPEFIDPDCHAWRTIGSATWGDIRTDQTSLRTERWATPEHDITRFLKSYWREVRAEAEARGLSSVWMLYQPEEMLVSIVSIAPPLTPLRPDLSLAVLEASPSMGPAFEGMQWEKTLDRTQWSLNIWFPYEAADAGEASLWPMSPPFPGPTATDGVCVPSRGETHASAPDDCTPTCGDGIRDADETWDRCPSDVRFW